VARIKKGDLVEVISGGKQDRGGDRGKQGKVLAVDFERNRVIVEGVNLVTRHNKVGQTDRGTKTGGIETKEAAIHISNVALVDPSTKKPTRIGAKVETVTRSGKQKTVRTRVAVKSGKEI
jgi:large subunit ribosomal protein L24